MKHLKHFIQLRINRVVGYINCIDYLYNDHFNKIGDFSTYYYNSIDNSWNKCRIYRGRYEYSKKPHLETSNGIKQWHYNKWYDSYEEYVMAAMG